MIRCNYWRRRYEQGNVEICRNGGTNIFSKDDIFIAVCDYNKQDFIDEHPDWTYAGRANDFKKWKR